MNGTFLFNQTLVNSYFTVNNEMLHKPFTKQPFI